jgi:hypothetical protein
MFFEAAHASLNLKKHNTSKYLFFEASPPNCTQIGEGVTANGNKGGMMNVLLQRQASYLFSVLMAPIS